MLSVGFSYLKIGETTGNDFNEIPPNSPYPNGRHIFIFAGNRLTTSVFLYVLFPTGTWNAKAVCSAWLWLPWKRVKNPHKCISGASHNTLAFPACMRCSERWENSSFPVSICTLFWEFLIGIVCWIWFHMWGRSMCSHGFCSRAVPGFLWKCLLKRYFCLETWVCVLNTTFTPLWNRNLSQTLNLERMVYKKSDLCSRKSSVAPPLTPQP